MTEICAQLLEKMNLHLFALLNAGPGLSGWPLSLATAAAEYFIYAVPVGLAVGWLWGSPNTRGALLMAALVGLLALGLNGLISLFWFHPRPFMIYVGHNYLAHAPDSSFPSDHVTLLWAVGLVLVTRHGTKFAGAVVLVFAMLTAWARVYLGVHFPLDMAGAALVATLAFLTLGPFQQVSNDYFLAALEYGYHRFLARAIAHGWINRRTSCVKA